MTMINGSPRAALGTWSWSSDDPGRSRNALTETELGPVVEAAFGEGIRLWDTAAVYGSGKAETTLGNLLSEYRREDYLLSTKFTPQIAGSSSTAIEEMLEASMRRLRTDYVDLYWIHNPSDIERWTHQLIPLVRSERVRQVGVSNHDLNQIKRVAEILESSNIPLSAVQNHHSLLYQACGDQGLLDYCAANGIDFYAYRVLERGALTGQHSYGDTSSFGTKWASMHNRARPKMERLHRAMAQVGEAHSASIAEVAVAWSMSKGAIPIVGSTRLQHVRALTRARRIVLTKGESLDMEALARSTGVDTRGSWEK